MLPYILGICACLCFECYQANVLRELGETASICCCDYGFWPAVRAHLRGKYRIKGSICTDFIVTSFCLTLSVMQIKNEHNFRVSAANSVRAPVVQTIQRTE